MSIPEGFSRLAGHWVGTNHLWLDPNEPARVSPTTLNLTSTAQDKFLSLHYTWLDEAIPQDGLLLIGYEPERNEANVVWIDSWHMQDKMMVCKGVCQDGAIVVKGAYSAPPGPDWGWQIDLHPRADGTLQMIMHNISPDGEMFLAIEATYHREP